MQENRDNRDNRKDKEYTEGIAIKGGFLGWLDNYWYHYKWHTVVIAFFVIVTLVCTLQMCAKESEDIVVIYSGSAALSGSDSEDICKVLESVIDNDFNGDGEKNIGMNKFNVLSEEEIREEREKKDEDGNPIFVDTNYYTSQTSNYYHYIQTGESSVAFLAPWLYEALAAESDNNISEGKEPRIKKLTDVLGYLPENAVGEYGVRLGDTPLYEEFGVMRKLPADTVVCLLSPLWKGGNSSKPEYYAREIAAFEAIVEYGTSEGRED